jgi:hypothetical protein
MPTTGKPAKSLYVDRECPANWIVRDRGGQFWIVSPGEGAWERGRPFQPSGEMSSRRSPGITCTCLVCRPSETLAAEYSDR